jgi:hypothetical protein
MPPRTGMSRFQKQLADPSSPNPRVDQQIIRYNVNGTEIIGRERVQKKKIVPDAYLEIKYTL